MKDTLTDANFPRTADGRTYHLSTRAGEIANRIIIVGSPTRAEAIAALFDEHPKTFRLSSERAFSTFTGRVKGVPISVVSIGMGFAMVDFFVREARECVVGDMIIVRIGSCGCLHDVPVGTLVVPKSSVVVTRNYDFDFADPNGTSGSRPYCISRQMEADATLCSAIETSLTANRPSGHAPGILNGTVNASADSFYATQGRQTSFPDHNTGLIDHLTSVVPNAGTFEMETGHLFHLAECWTKGVASSSPPSNTPSSVSTTTSDGPPVADAPAQSASFSNPPGESGPPASSHPTNGRSDHSRRKGVIRAAAVHMVFAARRSNDFISPQGVLEAEAWAGRGVVDALVGFEIDKEMLHEESGSVWEMK